MARKGKKSKGSKGKKAPKIPIEIREMNLFGPSAMLNAFYIAHNAAAFLEFRGYPWPGSLKKKGKKKQ